MENNNDSNEKEHSGKSIEFGLHMKLPLENMGLYYLAQRGNLLYERLQNMPSAKKSSFDKEVQELFTTITHEVEQMVHFSKHLPFIMKVEEEKIRWKIFNAEREYRIYYYLMRSDAQTINDFDSKLIAITFKFWDSYHVYHKGVQEYPDIESQLFAKLNYVIMRTRDDREIQVGPNEKIDNVSTGIKKTRKFTWIGFLILFSILAALHIISGLISYKWWDLAIGLNLLAITLLDIYFKHSSHRILILNITLGILLILLGGQFITKYTEYQLIGHIFVTFGVFNMVLGSILGKKSR
jgi:hypothetical protein